MALNMAKRKKILLCEFCQESNSFNPGLWGLNKFQAMLYCEGLVMRVVFTLKKSPVGGMLKAIGKSGARAVCGVAMRSGSGGPVEDEVLELFLRKTLAIIEAKGPFDGVFLSLHGATETPAHQDACGYIISAVREAAGRDAVITAACDMHANITPQMEKTADFICGFLTYPHVDFFETGFRAARLAMRKLGGEALHTACTRVCMIVPASGYTSKSGAFKEILDIGAAALAEGDIEDYTIFQMQPWLDVSEAASCAVVVSKSESAAKNIADTLAGALYSKREAFSPELESVPDILKIAARNKTGKPIVLGDAADSPNAGAPGDSVYVIGKLLESGLAVKTLTCVADCAAAEAAFDKGAGAALRLKLGGRLTPGLTSVEGEFTVRSLHSGSFRMAGPAGKGIRVRLGKTAILETGNVTILVCGTPVMCGDLNFFRSFGLEPQEYELVVVKANTSFRENYETLAASIHMADTPGAASADLKALPYKNLPDGFYRG